MNEIFDEKHCWSAFRSNDCFLVFSVMYFAFDNSNYIVWFVIFKKRWIWCVGCAFLLFFFSIHHLNCLCMDLACLSWAYEWQNQYSWEPTVKQDTHIHKKSRHFFLCGFFAIFWHFTVFSSCRQLWFKSIFISHNTPGIQNNSSSNNKKR